MIQFLFKIILFLFTVCCPFLMRAQGVVHPRRPEERNNIDAKSTITAPEAKEGLLRSREFIRIDSSYYVGYMYEGIYKASHAADYFGYNNAIPSLDKALSLLEKDYSGQLKSRTTDVNKLLGAYRLQMDYQRIASELWDCYMNTEKYNEAYKLIRRVQQWDLQLEYFFNVFNNLAWLTHKVRAHNHSRYSFLKNTVTENEVLAQSYLDSAVMRAKQNDLLNKYLMPDLVNYNLQSVVHYRALLYSYNLQIDSADKYYDLLQEQYFYSHNNRGNYLGVKGMFRAAEEEYEMEAALVENEKHLREFVYFQSIIDLNKGEPYAGIARLKNTIQAVGSTPGFGWYNIGLARAGSYDGDLIESADYLKKAERFKELHIGTSFGQRHYDFSLNMVKFLNAKRKLAWLKRRNEDWWYNPAVWGRLLSLQWEIYTTKYLILTQLADNPEREQVFYKIFASESTVSWDEIWMMIDELDPDFFITYFEKQLKEEHSRPVVQNYYRLFLAKLYMQKKEWNKTQEYLDAIFKDKTIDPEYEVLLLARCYELKAAVERASDDELEARKWYYHLYQEYPQLAGFGDGDMSFKIEWVGEQDKELMKRLKRADIEIRETVDAFTPIVRISSTGTAAQGKEVSVEVIDAEGKIMIPQQKFSGKDIRSLSYSLLRTMFGMALYRKSA